MLPLGHQLDITGTVTWYHGSCLDREMGCWTLIQGSYSFKITSECTEKWHVLTFHKGNLTCKNTQSEELAK